VLHAGLQLKDLAHDAYVQLLLLASEIQGAGPNLTPETFEAALLAARFPNPGAASAPFFQASGGYLGDSTFIDDVGLLWWDWGAGT
jgi:hypothetical protein